MGNQTQCGCGFARVRIPRCGDFGQKKDSFRRMIQALKRSAADLARATVQRILT
jgi:hypothetical protein